MFSNNEVSSFLILFVLFVLALEFNERDRINIAETAFMIFALGFTLEKVAAMQEHGINGSWHRPCPSQNLLANPSFSVFQRNMGRLKRSLCHRRLKSHQNGFDLAFSERSPY
jgi:hypothetical protein